MRIQVATSILVFLVLFTGDWEVRSGLKWRRRKVLAQNSEIIVANRNCTPIAKIITVRGDVKITEPGSRPRSAQNGEKLCEDNFVKVERGGFVQINCESGKVLPQEGPYEWTKNECFLASSTLPSVSPLSRLIVASGQPLNSPLGRGVIGIGQGDQGPGVRDLQNRLRALGYFNAESTGFFASNTRNAVISFQQAYGIPATGLVSEETLVFLNNRVAVLPENPIIPTPENPIPTPPTSRILRRGDNHPRVGVLQQRLFWLGFYDGRITEKFDERTEQAVINFQRYNGIQPTGQVGATTEAYIERAIDSL